LLPAAASEFAGASEYPSGFFGKSALVITLVAAVDGAASPFFARFARAISPSDWFAVDGLAAD
jgi:hypothetical protein